MLDANAQFNVLKNIFKAFHRFHSASKAQTLAQYNAR